MANSPGASGGPGGYNHIRSPPSRLYPKHHDPVVLRRVARNRAELSKGKRISNDVIGRKSNDDRIAAAPQGARRTCCDGRSGILTHRLEQDICLRANCPPAARPPKNGIDR